MTPSACPTTVLIVSPHVRRRESLQALIRAILSPRQIICAAEYSEELLNCVSAETVSIIYDGSALTEATLIHDVTSMRSHCPKTQVILYRDQPIPYSAGLTDMADGVLHAGSTTETLQHILLKGIHIHEA